MPSAPLPLPANPSRPARHVGTHRRPHQFRWPLRRPARPGAPGTRQPTGRRRSGRFGVLGMVAWALAVLVGLGGCGPAGTSPEPVSTPAAVPSASDSPTASPTPTAAQPTPTTATPAAPVAQPTTQAAAPPAADPAPAQQQPACGPDYYVNSDGTCVHRPVQAPAAPPGATARCNDGTYSFSQHRQGTCSGHGGVATWL
jgi:hypothetical protein